jgi:hypothetical protein
MEERRDERMPGYRVVVRRSGVGWSRPSALSSCPAGASRARGSTAPWESRHSPVRRQGRGVPGPATRHGSEGVAGATGTPGAPSLEVCAGILGNERRPSRWGRPSCGGRYWDRTSDLFRVREARYRCANRPVLICEEQRMGYCCAERWRWDSNPRIRLCRPLPRLSATPPGNRNLTNPKVHPSGRRDSNPRPSPWQGDALPLSHVRATDLHRISPAFSARHRL